MENQDYEETQDFDEQDIGSDDDNEEQGLEDTETNPNKKNQSNFKALYNKKKELEKALSERDERLAAAEAELEEWRKLNPEALEELNKNKEYSGIQEKIFFIENPDAKTYAKEIRAAIKEYNLPNDDKGLSKAWKLVKSDIPEESKTKLDFNIGKKNISNKNLKDVTPEEALELPKEKKREWRKIHGYEG